MLLLLLRPRKEAHLPVQRQTSKFLTVDGQVEELPAHGMPASEAGILRDAPGTGDGACAVFGGGRGGAAWRCGGG